MDRLPHLASEVPSRSSSADLSRGNFIFSSFNLQPQPPDEIFPKKIKFSTPFKRLLFIAILLPAIALILIVFCVSSKRWETVRFDFHKLIQLACSNQTSKVKCFTPRMHPFLRYTPVHPDAHRRCTRSTLRLGHLVLESGNSITISDWSYSDERYAMECRPLIHSREPQRQPKIIGIGIYEFVSVRDREWMLRNNTVSGFSMPETGNAWEMFNIQVGVFQVCYDIHGKSAEARQISMMIFSLMRWNISSI